MLSAHTLLITGICVAYFGSMAALFGYMAHQVHHHDRRPEDDVRQEDRDEPGELAIAA